MSTVFAERPRFFEGQYLGADDLESFLTYAREHDARHLLGAHTWGIVSGIELQSAEGPAGDFEYFITPGVAADGYGRLIVVTAPYKLTADLFAHEPSGAVNVWIRHEESPAGGVRPGFETCDCDDGYARVAESFVVEVGLRNTVELRESGVTVADEVFTDAREAPGAYRPAQPLACDGSVPAQAFPTEDQRSLWLVPVGQVPWQKGSPGQFLESTEADLKGSRIFRRQAGIVTEHIYAPDGLIRLRARFAEAQAGVDADTTCAEDAIEEGDLVMCGETLTPRERIWLEGDTRFTGHARLRGRRLEFQEAEGTDYLDGGVVLGLRRRPDRNEHDGFDLEVLLGARQGADGPTRLTIGKATVQGTDPCAVEFDLAPGVYVQEDAKVGIGTTDSLLTLPLTIRGIGDNGDLIGFEAADGSLAWQMNLSPAKNGLNFTEEDPTETRLFLRNDGNVGIATLAPEAKLDIRDVPASSGGQALGSGKWFQVGDGGDSGRIWFQYGDQSAPLIVLTDLDNPPRVQFQQTGSGDETAPQYSSWIGQARNESPDLALMGGDVGVGVLNPFRTFHVEGEMHTSGSSAGYSFGNREHGSVSSPANGERWVWYSTSGVARLWSGDDKLGVTAAGRLGLGTLSPAERLDVRGNVKLGANGNFFGVGCVDNVRMVAGRVDEGGGELSGSGYSASKTAEGRYHVQYATAFSSTPVVVATLVDALNEDNFLCVGGSDATGFDVFVKDDDNTAAADWQDSAFNFIALGPRA